MHPALINYTYDALKRPLTIGNAVGTTTNSYVNWKVATIDPRGKEKDVYDDAYNNLIQVDEHNGTSTYSTSYTYDGLQDLTNITDALGDVRNFTYDGLGRRLTAQDLHASTDATYGAWTYTYDDANNLTQQVDPKNQTSTYAYDTLNRVTSESFGGQTQIAYTYDTCTQGVGRLCMASSSDAVVTSTYNTLGQLNAETKTIASTTYTTSYTYDRQGNQLTITNPDNSQIAYTYNLAGLAESVTQKPNGGSVATVVSNFDYSPTDQPSIIAYANNVTVTNTYDPTKLYRLTQKVGSLPAGGNGQNIAYTYDAVGNITQLVDTSNSGAGRTVNYTYDDLSRLTVASTTNVSTTPGYAQTFTYDALGNITSGPLGTYSYAGNTGSNYADPDAVTSIAVSTSTTGGTATSTISFVQAFLSSTGGASVTSTMTGVGGGNLLMVEQTYTGTMTSTPIIDDAGTPIFITSSTWHSTAHSYLYYERNVTAGTHNFHTSFGSAPSFPKVHVTEYAGANTSTPLDTFSAATGTGDPVTASAMTSAGVNEMAFAFGNAAGATLTGGTNFTLRGTDAEIEDNATSTRAAGSSVSTTFSGSAGNDWVIQGALIKPVAGVAGSSTATSTTSFTYDNNGNLLTTGNATDTWNYRNQLTQSTNGTATSSYAYDYRGNRVKLIESGITTIFPTKFYNVTLGTTSSSVEHIFADGLLLASIQNQNATTTNGYQYYRAITVTSTTSIASGTNVNFPMLVSSTFSSWATVANGGRVQNLVTAPNGGKEPADLVFATSSANCNLTGLNFETESYTSSTGALVDWVNVPSVSTGTVIYACYDNTAVTTDQSHPSGTWNNNYVSVWHFTNGTILNASDSTANVNNGVISGPTATAGKIDGAGSYTGSPNAIQGTSTDLTNASFTIEMWHKPSSTPNMTIFGQGGAGAPDQAIHIRALSSTAMRFGMYSDDLDVTVSAMANNWNYTVATLDASKVQTVYENGALIGSRTASAFFSGTTFFTVGRDPFATADYYVGSIDEIRVSKTARSPSWILTAYNSENAPSSFYSVGVETAAGGGGGSNSSTVSYISGDNLGGTNMVTNASGTIVETLDYYPYGAARLDNKAGGYSGDKRKFDSMERDSASGLDYAVNRYYDNTRGQFVSEDPSFFAVGDSGKVQQVTGISQPAFLADPQQMNSYSWGRDNPITQKDPTGKYFEISGSIVIPGRSFSAGIQIDQYGIVGFFGGGFGSGGGGGVEVAWAPGQTVPHQRNASINISGEYADGIGGRMSQDISQYSPDAGRTIPVGGPSYAAVLGAGGGIGIQQQLSFPLPYLTWGNPPANNFQHNEAPATISGLPKAYLSQSPGSGRNNGGGAQLSSASAAALQQALNNLSNTVKQLQSTVSVYSAKQ